MPGPEPKDSAAKLLRVVRLTPKPYVTVSDVETETEVGKKQTQNRLDDMAADGLLKTEKVGTANLYWLSDEGAERLASEVSVSEVS
jgi:hypothetical protein